MYDLKDYLNRGAIFLHNRVFPNRKKLATVMIYATDLCDSACKHCQIWTKRPVSFLPKQKIFDLIQHSTCITSNTTIGLEGGEFMLHPDAIEILEWLHTHHPKFDLLSNCLKPEALIAAVKKFPPKRLWVSLDGNEETYQDMRGKNGYNNVLRVIRELKSIVGISVMFTLSPYNDFDDLKHVADICKNEKIDLRIGVYNNIPLFETIEDAHKNEIGSLKKKGTRSLSEVKTLLNDKRSKVSIIKQSFDNNNSLKIKEKLPDIVKNFPENFDFLTLYDEWQQGGTKLTCNSILDSLVILPNGDVPICQHLEVLTGNIFTNTLDQIFNGPETRRQLEHYSKNCNACWINFHRKYDIVLFRNFEKYFGRRVTQKLLGYYWWEREKKKSYNEFVNS